jgi:uroporphyrinogen-III synthase
VEPLVVAILETRTGEHLAELVLRLGATPMLAPALEEVPDVDPGSVSALLEGWDARPFKMAIFQTGVGTRALFQATDALGSTAALCRLLESAIIVVRGPKPVGELNARLVRIDIRAASPFTTESVTEAVKDVALGQSRVLIQRYGQANQRLREALQSRGATVEEIATYRWALPSDTRPLERLIDALSSSRVDATVFTSAVQIQNLYAVAERMNRAGDLAALLNRTLIASIGPVCSRALMERGIKPGFEANPPKLGPLMAGLESALKQRRG